MTKIDELYTENDFTLEPFQMPPDHDIWCAINALNTLINSGIFSENKDMCWRLQDFTARLHDQLEKE